MSAQTPIRYYHLDEHVRSAVAAYLRTHGIDVLTAQEAGRAGQRIADADQLRFASEHDRVLVSSDTDFLNPTVVPQIAPGQHAGVVWIKYDVTITIGDHARYLRYLAAAETTETMAGHVRYYEPAPRGLFPDD